MAIAGFVSLSKVSISNFIRQKLLWAPNDGINIGGNPPISYIQRLTFLFWRYIKFNYERHFNSQK